VSAGIDHSQTPHGQAEPAAKAMACWLDCLGNVMESMTQSRAKVASQRSPSNHMQEGVSWWSQSLSLLEQPSFWIGAPAASWDALGRVTLSGLGVDEPSDSDLQATCRDLIAQTSASLASQLTQQSGETITSGDSLPVGAPDLGRALMFLWTLDVGATPIKGAVVWSGAFLDHCARFMSEAPLSETGTPEAAPAASDSPKFAGLNMGAIPELDLRVKFVLGQTTMLLRDVFKLNVGSVIVLDRSAVGNADIVIGGRIVACGQVVVVNGNYGLKIKPYQEAARH